MDYREKIDVIAKESLGFMVEQRRYLHANPRISFQEQDTAQYLMKQISAMGPDELRPCGTNGIIATVKGAAPGPCIAFRADMDALEITEETGKSYASTREGWMHACGHDFHTAALMGLLRSMLKKREMLRGDVRFIFQDDEEIFPGGAKAMIEDGCLDGVDRIYGLHVDDELPTGHVGICPGPYMASSIYFSTEIHCNGGHGAKPFVNADPISAATEAIRRINEIPCRFTDPNERAIVNICYINGGNAYNVVPVSVQFGGTARVYSSRAAELIRARIDAAIRTVCDYYGTSYKFEYQIGYPPVCNHARESRVVEDAASFASIPCRAVSPTQLGEDFARYLELLPGALFRIGIRNEEKGTVYPLHHCKFDVDEDALVNALKMYWSIYLIEMGQAS